MPGSATDLANWSDPAQSEGSPAGAFEGQIPGAICSHLGLFDDRTLVRSLPTPSHRCFLGRPPGAPEAAHQTHFCLGGHSASCPLYVAAHGGGREVSEAPSAQAAQSESPQAGSRQTEPTILLHPAPFPAETRRGTGWLLTLAGTLLVFAVCGIAAYFGMAWLYTPPALASTRTNAAPAQPTWTPIGAVSATEPAPAGVLLPTVTPTPEGATAAAPSGGQSLTLEPELNQVGWWTDANTPGGHGRGNLGDSFLYAGTRQGADFVSAARFDLRLVARGAAIEGGTLRLTGLRDERTQADPTTVWIVQLVPNGALPDLGRADYQALMSAPAPITFDPIEGKRLAGGAVVELPLDAPAREWLAQQLIDGATGVIVRIHAWTSSADNLFAFDSGAGSASADAPPQLALRVGAPPATPPPTATKPFLVATLTPEPENMMTAVALAATATEVARAIGTYTPVPFEIHTPTPYPGNIATQQAIAVEKGLPPIVLPTHVPGSPAEATEQALYPTLVAITTGTFTPTPAEYVTPMVILPSPPAANLATEAARVAEATAQASQWDYTTPTPLPYNAVVGEYVFATATPENIVTAAAVVVESTAAAIVNGTATPLPFYAVIITPSPTPTATPLPLLMESTVTPSPTPTAPPDTLPDAVRGKILFKSNRGGGESIYLLDPATGGVELVTQSWVYPLARKQLSLSADGRNLVYVQKDGDQSVLRVKELEYARDNPILLKQGLNYDPAWSPDGVYVAYASNLPGNDEIYRVPWDHGEPERLTNNSWEWDKHPTWSPDGSQIVFFSNRDGGRRQLWIMNADGSGQRNLSNNEFDDWDPVWVH